MTCVCLRLLLLCPLFSPQGESKKKTNMSILSVTHVMTRQLGSWKLTSRS